MACISDGKAKLLEVSKDKDGLGLAEQQESVQNVNEGVPEEDDGDQFLLRALVKKHGRGRPTNARDKPSYECLTKRPRFCKQCSSSQHTRQSCPNVDPATKKARAPPRCCRCGLTAL